MNYIEKVGNNKIGFTLTNNQLITRETFQSVGFFYEFFMNPLIFVFVLISGDL
jgi:hypothetical protein